MALNSCSLFVIPSGALWRIPSRSNHRRHAGAQRKYEGRFSIDDSKGLKATRTQKHGGEQLLAENRSPFSGLSAARILQNRPSVNPSYACVSYVAKSVSLGVPFGPLWSILVFTEN